MVQDTTHLTLVSPSPATSISPASAAHGWPGVYPYGFSLPIEELPLFSYQHKGETLCALLVDGWAEVEYDHSGDWHVTNLRIQCENYKFGTLNRATLANLDADRDERLYLLILDAFDKRYTAYIEQRIAEELADPEHAEHDYYTLAAAPV
jgi:hypothetical protein